MLALGVIGILPTASWGGSLGFGPWAVIIAVMLLGVASILFGSASVPLSDVGAETAVSWKAFNNQLERMNVPAPPPREEKPKKAKKKRSKEKRKK